MTLLCIQINGVTILVIWCEIFTRDLSIMDMIGGNLAIIYHDDTCIKQNKYFHLGGGEHHETVQWSFQKFSARSSSLTRNHLFRFKNALKFTWGRVEKPNIFPGVIPRTPASRGGEGWWCRQLDLLARRPWTWARISGLVHFKSLKVCVRNYFTDILICFYTKKNLL